MHDAGGGWLLMPFLGKIGQGAVRNRVSAERTIAFAIHYRREIYVIEMLELDIANAYYRRVLSDKYLLAPNHRAAK